jgi:hypothetical protein
VKRYDPTTVEDLFDKAGFRIDNFAAIDIPWPSAAQAKILCSLLTHAPTLIHSLAKFVDALPSSAVRKPISLEKWHDKAPTKLQQYSTGLFILHKK